MESKSLIEHSKTSTDNDEEKIAFDLLKLPTISKAIFKYLSGRDLSSCAKLCRSWNATATRIKQKREHIYIIKPIEPGISELKNLLMNSSYNLWSEPSVAISFFLSKSHENAKQSFNDEELYYRHYALEYQSHSPFLKQLYIMSIQKARRQKRLRNYLPEKCTLVNLMTARSWQHTPLGFPSSALILIPSNRRVQVQPFVIPCRHQSDICTSREVEPLFLSGESTCLESNVKCLVAFKHPLHPTVFKRVLDTKIHANTSVEKYVSEETIVVSCYSSLFPINLGIAFAGEKVRSECVAINDRDCCLENCLSFLANSGFNEERGIAFVLKRVFVILSKVFNFWSEHFPNITPLLIESSNIRTCIPRSIGSLQKCNLCSTQLSLASQRYHPYVILFVLFENINCKIILD